MLLPSWATAASVASTAVSCCCCCYSRSVARMTLMLGASLLGEVLTLRKRYTQLTRAAMGPSKVINLIEKALGPVALKKTGWFWLKMEAEVQQKWDRAVKQSSS